MAFAENTKVPIEKSKVELETLLAKLGAGRRATFHDSEKSVAGAFFELAGRRYRIEVPIPRLADFLKPKPVPYGWDSWSITKRAAWSAAEADQAARQRWRALILLVKAKIEIVAMGASTFEREFLADLVLPNGRTAGEELGEYMQNLLANGYSAPLALPEYAP